MTIKEARAPRQKPGPKPQGERSMTSTERARKRRDLMREEGYRAFLMYVAPDRLRYIERYAQLQGMTASAAFHELMDRQLAHLVDCMTSAEYLLSAGESDFVAKVFIDAHIAHTSPPTLEELAAQFKKET
ncbi:hypothetical protein [Comamonas testosteroni]|uniref:hypothetical protein n=1 Tax=Comamonas testosteroni TaxID=285 RepID=UPI0028E5EE50|nr:hypothetical protein [Comamonas testosteroni]